MQSHSGTQTSTAWSTRHPISAADAAATAAARSFTAPMKGQLRGVAARQPFDEIMGHVPAPEGVTYEPDTVGGVPGWWCRPAGAEPGGAILYLHGGWYAWGSAAAYRHLAGQVAARAGVPAFVPDYRLSPEHPFPAGALDVRACWQGLVARGVGRIAVVGDSAGGGLALALATRLAQERPGMQPVAVAALSPVTDLTLSGDSWTACAEADPYFTRPQAQGQVDAYLAGHDAADPQASPLFADLAGLPSVRVVVGGDEVLRDDALRFAERAAVAGADAHVDLWEGMPHVFLSGVGQLEAASQALAKIGVFLSDAFSASA